MDPDPHYGRPPGSGYAWRLMRIHRPILLKAVSGLRGGTYEERLAELGLPSLQDRRREIDMVQTFKILRGLDVKSDSVTERTTVLAANTPKLWS